MSNAFQHVPHTVQGHFLLNFYAAVHCLLCHLERLGQIADSGVVGYFERYPFLTGYLDELRKILPDGLAWEDGAGWWAGQIADWEDHVGSDLHLPLRSLADEVGLGFESRIALMIAGLVDEDSRFGTLFAHIQAPLPYRRPCLETVGQMMAPVIQSCGTDAWIVCRPLLQADLVEGVNRDEPRPEWILRVPAMLWDAIRGVVEPHPAPGYRMYLADVFPALDDLVMPSAFLERLRQMPILMTSKKVDALLLRGMRGSERLAILGAVSRALGRGVVEVQPLTIKEPGRERVKRPNLKHLGPLCTMARCMPVIVLDDLGPGEVTDLPQLNGYDGPVGVIVGFEGGLQGPLIEKALTLAVPLPQHEQRLRLWRRALVGRSSKDLHEIASRFLLPGGHIRQVGSMAVAQAALDCREEVQVEDVRIACRMLNRQVLDTLAAYVETEGTWSRLVVGEATAAKLYELEQRCRHRERLLEHLGVAFGATVNRGVRALFTGPSGTGKTLAAKILASELGMDLYRVDLASVINKYIGETEKNLHRVLSRAEELDVILLLDEGDALLGNRTAVRSANDRYANLETNYLLQRLESYRGILVVTTNAGQYIDRAFQRRMDVVVGFVPPNVHERLAIWQLHLPQDHAVDGTYLEKVATLCVMTGGQIRNAALHATLLAVDDAAVFRSDGVVRQHHLMEAVRSEYRKAGALCPLNGNGRHRESCGDMERFLRALAT
jgi:hypothetical protein